MAESVEVVIRKPAGATHFKNVYNVAERKMLNGCWYVAGTHGFKLSEYSMDMSEFKDFLGINTLKNREWAKDIIRGLAGKTVEWNGFSKDRTREWGVCTFLQSGKIRGNKFYFRLNQEFLSWAQDPAVWTRLRLMFQVSFTGKHAITLYEFFHTEMDTSGNPKAQEFYIDVALDDLRKLLNLGAKQYPRYSNFRQHVLIPAQDEINLRSDISVAFEGLKRGRSFNAVRFHIQKKQAHQLPLDLPDLNIEKAAEASLELATTPSEQEEEVLDLLDACDLSKRKARELLAIHRPVRIKRNIAYALADQMDGKVKKLSGYLLKSIEADYGEKLSVIKVNEILNQWRAFNAEAIVFAEKKKEEAAINANKAAYSQHRAEKLTQMLSVQSKDWLPTQQNEFLAGELPAIVKDQYDSEGWDSAFVQAAFKAKLSDILLTAPEDKSVENFIAWRLKQPTIIE